MKLSQSPPNGKIDEKSEPKSDFREKIRHRQNIESKVFDYNQTLDIGKKNFWEKFLNQGSVEVLIVSDNQHEIEISGATFGDKILKYFDKTSDMVFMSRLDDLSKDFTKEVLISFCENKNNWKSKLE